MTGSQLNADRQGGGWTQYRHECARLARHATDEKTTCGTKDW
jgi:hypothetical protein